MRSARWFLLVSLGGCAGVDFRERHLGTLPDDASLRGLAAFSSDGCRVAYVERSDGARRAVCGAWKSRTFDLVC